MAICAGLLFSAAIIAQVLSLCLRLQNRARDKMHGRNHGDEMPEGVFELGDEHPMYRYII